MSIRKKIKKETIQRIERATPKIQGLEVPSKKAVTPWKVAVPSLAAACAVVAIVVPVALNPFSITDTPNTQEPVPSNVPGISSAPMASPDVLVSFTLAQNGFVQPKREARTLPFLAQDSIDLYKAFYRNTAPLALAGIDGTKSYSVFDAFVNFAMLSYFSEGDAQTALLSLFDTNDPSGLPKAVSELTWALGTPILKTKSGIQGQVAEGGYSANSLWYDSAFIEPRADEKGAEAYKTLKEAFFASLFSTRPTGGLISEWLEQSLPDGYPIPSIPGDLDTDVALVSSYFLKVPQYNAEYVKQWYEKGEDRLDYSFLGTKIRSGYSASVDRGGTYYESKDLIGATQKAFGLSVFLPKDKDALPSTILGEVVSEGYEVKSTKGQYSVTIPYFAIDKQDLALHELFAPKTGWPLPGFVCQSLFTNPLVVEKIDQYSRLSFDYDGFYSASATIAEIKDTTALPGDTEYYEPFELIADRPFVFRESIFNDGTELPVVIGTVVDPGYEK